MKGSDKRSRAFRLRRCRIVLLSQLEAHRAVLRLRRADFEELSVRLARRQGERLSIVNETRSAERRRRGELSLAGSTVCRASECARLRNRLSRALQGEIHSIAARRVGASRAAELAFRAVRQSFRQIQIYDRAIFESERSLVQAKERIEELG